MPRLNGMGPQGAGPMTGRGMGYCNSNYVPTNSILGFGYSRGFGRGLGRGCGKGLGFVGNYGVNYYTPPEMTPEQKKDMLNQDKAFLEDELKRIDEQLAKI